MRVSVLVLSAALSAAVLAGCSETSTVGIADPNASETPDAMLGISQTGAEHRALDRPTVWADDELFGAVVVTGTFKPTAGYFDELYAGGDGFKGGHPLISESKPGDTDYNGGRWHMNVLKDGVAADKYKDASSVEDLDLNDFMSTDNYFECPMTPIRGSN